MTMTMTYRRMGNGNELNKMTILYFWIRYDMELYIFFSCFFLFFVLFSGRFILLLLLLNKFNFRSATSFSLFLYILLLNAVRYAFLLASDHLKWELTMQTVKTNKKWKSVDCNFIFERQYPLFTNSLFFFFFPFNTISVDRVFFFFLLSFLHWFHSKIL